jgi:group II intron reverse transcriptase/maturase/CRISPR-associated endonuclease Cas1
MSARPKTSTPVRPATALLFSIHELNLAWQLVEKREAAGGADRVSVETFAKDAPEKLAALAARLQDGTYVPEPYLSIRIPKSHKPGMRTLGLPSVADKVVQQVLLNRLNRIAAKTLLPCTYAYRPGKGPVKAVKQALHLLAQKNQAWMVRADIDNFFDEIPHSLLEATLLRYTGSAALTGLCMLFVRMGNVDQGQRWKDRTAGIPQGALISPVIANLFLHGFDQAMTASGFGYVRYADDLLFTAADETAAQGILQTAAEYLHEHYGLRFNADAAVLPAAEGCTFLGVHINSQGINLPQQKHAQLVQRLYAALQADGKALPAAHWKETMEGIARYYGRLLPETVLRELDQSACELLAKEWVASGQPGLNKTLRSTLGSLAWCSQWFNSDPSAGVGLIRNKINTLQTRQIAGENTRKIASRKRFYEKLSDQHSELVVHTPGTFLSVSKGKIVVKQNGKVLQTLRVQNLRHITVRNLATGFSGQFIALCAEQGISLHFAQGKKHLFLHDPEQDDTRLWELQLRESRSPLGAEIARELVLAKTAASAHLLHYFLKYKGRNAEYRVAAAGALTAIGRETAYIEALPAAAINTNILELTAAEGRAAQAYWTALSALGGEIPFPGRSGQGAGDTINAMLNYGYAILYNRVWESIRAVGLHPGISFLHVPVKGKSTLGFDLMEPFRAQVVDRVVFGMVHRGQVKTSDGRLSEALRKQLATAILSRLHRREMYRGSRRPLETIIRMNLFMLADVLKGENKKFKPYRGKW